MQKFSKIKTQKPYNIVQLIEDMYLTVVVKGLNYLLETNDMY